MFHRYVPLIAVTMLLFTGTISLRTASAIEVPIKDLTRVEDEHSNVLTGLGLVTGLNGTGGEIPPTRQFLVNMMQRFGVPFDPVMRLTLENNNRLTTESMSVVVVTARIRTTDQVNKEIDATVAAVDGATDLNNGELMATLLRGLDNRVYAVASGRVNTGGILATGAAATVQVNHPTTGYARALVKERVPNSLHQKGSFHLLLHDPDYTTRFAYSGYDQSSLSQRGHDQGPGHCPRRRAASFFS